MSDLADLREPEPKSTVREAEKQPSYNPEPSKTQEMVASDTPKERVNKVPQALGLADFRLSSSEISVNPLLYSVWWDPTLPQRGGIQEVYSPEDKTESLINTRTAESREPS